MSNELAFQVLVDAAVRAHLNMSENNAVRQAIETLQKLVEANSDSKPEPGTAVAGN